MSNAAEPAAPVVGAYPAIGDVLDAKYRIEGLLGEGGMGAVMKATHLVRKAPVALKFMNPRFTNIPEAVSRFVNEAVAASQIQSDHVVKVFDVGRLGGMPYLVMEFLVGRDLGDLRDREGRPGLPIPRAVHFALQILRGLQAAHRAGVIHRDMKPSNCFVVSHEGEEDFVKILDFGISKVQVDQDASLTHTHASLGTPLYMSPEQARSSKDADVRTDLWSAGVILYELLTGRTPYEADSLNELMYLLFTADPTPIRTHVPDLPEGLVAVIGRALARNRDERFASAEEMANALAPFAPNESMALLARICGQRFSTAAPPGTSMPPAISIPPPARAPDVIQVPVNLSSVQAKTDQAAPHTMLDVARSVSPAATHGGRTGLVFGGIALLLLVASVIGYVSLRNGAAPEATESLPPEAAQTAVAARPEPQATTDPAPSSLPTVVVDTSPTPVPSASHVATAAPTVPKPAPTSAQLRVDPNPLNLRPIE